MNEFDIKAAEWDKNQMHWDRSETIAKDIMQLIPLDNTMTALEYGAGTGITSFLLKDKVKEITLMDNSTEMVKITKGKINSSGATNLKTIVFDLENADYTDDKFDLIFTQMVLHHVKDIQSITSRFYDLLNKGGYLAIADLYEEDGSFHGDGFTGHKGFNPGNLSEMITELGFRQVSVRKCFTIDKKVLEKETKKFDLFLMIAVKP